MGHVSIKKIVNIVLLSFFLAVLLNDFYCHNSLLSLPSCSFCKVKTSLSGTFNKSKIASSTGVAVIIWSMSLFLLFFAIIPSRDGIFIDSRITFPFSNKAPPAE